MCFENRPAHDNIIDAGAHGIGGRHYALLIITLALGGSDAGGDDHKTLTAGTANVGHFVRRSNHSIHSRFFRQKRQSNDLVGDLNTLTPAMVNESSGRLVHPDSLTWVVVGDLSKIEKPVRALNFGELTVLDTDGKPVVR